MRKVALLLMAMIFVFAFASCLGGGEVPEGGVDSSHVHNFEGALQYNTTAHFNRCECGKAGNAEAHVDDNTDGVCDVCSFKYQACEHEWLDANCVLPSTCSKCGITEGEAHGHTEAEAVVENNVAPDCVNAGSYDSVVYCSVCQEELSRETVTVNALGHAAGEVVKENNVDPNCVNGGSYDNVVYCSVCEVELSRETVTVNALGHTAGEVIKENNVDPDCDDKGSYDNVVYCSVCGEELSRETVIVNALGHAAGEVVKENNVDPDCVNAGSYDNVVYCSVCQEELSRESITVDALGHAEVNHEAKAPTCEGIGWEVYVTCSRCDYSTYDEIPATGHTDGEVVVENNDDPDCLNAGSYDSVVYCSVCQEELSRENKTVDALGHAEVNHEAKAPTCEGIGWEAYVTCSRCDYTTYVEIPANGHNFENGNCVHCVVCGVGQLEEKTTGVIIKDYASANGWANSYKYTSVSLSESVYAEAIGGRDTGKYYTNGNNWRFYESESGTLTIKSNNGIIVSVKITYEDYNNGILRYNGSDIESGTLVAVNAASITFSVERTGGDKNGQVRITAIEVVYKAEAATCEHEWLDATCETAKKCSKCNCTIGEALGHSYKSVVTAPTCTEQGFTTHTCLTCGDTFVDNEIPANGHTAGEVVVKNSVAADCVNDGSYDNVVYCLVCGDEISRETIVVPAKGHSYEAADYYYYDSALYHVYEKCSACGDENASQVSEGTVVGVKTASDAMVALNAGYSVKLLNNLKLDEIIVVEGEVEVTLYLNEKTILADWESEETVECLLVKNGAKLTVTGNGTMVSGTQAATNSVISALGGHVIIENGNFTSNSYGTVIFAKDYEGKNGIIEVRGGRFEAKEKFEGKYYVLDIDERYPELLGEIIVTGGEFVNWNPANHSNDGSANSNKLEIGYHAINVDGTYVVGAHTAGAAVVENSVAADCVNDGSYDNVVYCLVCGDEISRETIVVPALGHTASEVVVENSVAADCVKDGSYDSVVYCSTCKAELSRTEVVVPALGHTASDWIIDEEATYEQDGLKHKECTVCGTLLESEEIPMLSHSYVSVVTAPTCTEQGFTTYTCSDCGDVYVSDYVDALGHDEEIIPGKAATCTEIGWDAYETCSRCDYTTYVEKAATGHSYNAVVTAPTCEEDGYTTYTCDCGDTYVANETEATGHSYNAVVTAPTCTANGFTTYTCSDCGDVYVSDYVDALGHDEEIIPGKAATCTETGLTEGKKCSVCGATTVAQEVIGALGHTEEVVAGKAATCTETGLTEGKKCSVCGATTVAQEAIPVGDHSWQLLNGNVYECKVCEAKGVKEETAESKTYTFSNYTAGTQYADNEKHEMDDILTITTTDAHFTSELRLYSSSTYNAYAILSSTKTIKSISFNMGYKTDTLNIYTSNDGKTWTLREGIATTTTDYKDYATTLEISSKYVKLDVNGLNQIRIKSITVTYVSGGGEITECMHTNRNAATCENPETCLSCGLTFGGILEHDFTGDWKFNETNHWKVCANDCGEQYDFSAHTFVNNICSVCDYKEVVTQPFEVVFELGANGSASHNDGSDASTASTKWTVDGYTLSFTSLTKVYSGARDAKGNSCLKLGTSSAVGSFSFTVSEEVTSVIIMVAQYKSNTTKINVNGTAYTITTSSNNGAYTAITIDTTTTKTITFKTVSGGVRCMVDSIIFKGVK